MEQRSGPLAFINNNGELTSLGTFGGLTSYARAINEAGQVTGNASNTSGYMHAFLWTNGIKRDLGNLVNIPNVDSYGYGINDAGQVVGGSQYFWGQLLFHAFIYSDGVMTDLGTFGGTESVANDINNAGQIVGWAALATTNAHRAFLYENGTMINMNALIPADSGWTLTEANGINEQGSIVGKGTINGVNHAFLLTPLTPPASRPPTVSLNAPANGASYTAPVNLTITAGAASVGDEIARVDFYAGTNLLGTDATAPYEILWGSVPPGTYALTAVAFDTSNRSTTSHAVNVTINTPPATLSNWVLQSPLPTNAALHGASLISATEGWVVGDEGTILHFKDGRLEQQFAGTTEQLNAVKFVDAQRGWAVGNTTLYTTNGGFTWQAGTNTTGSGLGTLYGLEVADADHLWAIGNGALVRSVDGGRVWSPVQGLPATGLGLPDFIDAQNGWLGGDNGKLYRTTDGGAHWTLQPTNTTQSLAGVKFVNANDGWAGVNNQLLHTADGGATWSPQTLPPGTWIYDLFFLDAQHGWAVGAQENLIRTIDGGQTWTTIRGGAGSSGVSPFWSVYFTDATHGAIVSTSALYLTDDAGITLVPPHNGSQNQVNKVFALDTQHAWAANRKAEVMRTTDGGGTWQPVQLFTPTTGSDVSDVDFSDTLNGWAVVKAGPPGFVYRTANGGATWQHAGAPTTGALSGIDALDTQTVVAIGTDGTRGLVLRSTDGGATWTTATPSAVATNFNAVHFIGGGQGWLVGDKGVILKTTDAGATWTAQASGLGASAGIVDVSFADANNGWAVAGQTLLHTTNGGQTWSAQSYGSSFALNAVSAVSAQSAWVSGNNGLVKRTVNAGATWTQESLLTNADFYACAFVNADTGWIGGSLFSYTDPTGRLYKHVGGVPNTQLANTPPTVSLGRTTGGSFAASVATATEYTALADVPLYAVAADSDGQVRKVDFYNGATLIGTDTAAPYQMTWLEVPTGTYTVTAIATDNAGATAVSNIVTFTINEPRYQIAGRVTSAQGTPLGGVTMSLSGARGEVVQTDASGYYQFTNLQPGANYTVAPTRGGFVFNPASLAVNGMSASATGDFVGGVQGVGAGDVLITEFRFNGPAGALDEFVELYNATAQPITVQSFDGSPGWMVAARAADEQIIVDAITIPNGTIIPARGHYLATNSGNGADAYSLSGQTAGDMNYTFDLPDATGIALFTTANPNNFAAATRLDAVGFTTADALYREGTGLAPATLTAADEQYSYVRRATTGLPQDTNDNAQDFALISTTGALGGAAAQLGTPGPENVSSPIQRNATVKATLIDRFASATGAPNRVRDTTPVNNGALGTLTIRRRFTNKTGGVVTALRFRIVDITTLNTPNPGGTQADLRGLDSVDVTVTTGSGNVLVRGTTLEQPPVQSAGGGLNSTFKVNLQGGALVNGASVDVQFVLGVQAGGSFRFLINVEALTGASTGTQKIAGPSISK